MWLHTICIVILTPPLIQVESEIIRSLDALLETFSDHLDVEFTFVYSIITACRVLVESGVVTADIASSTSLAAPMDLGLWKPKPSAPPQVVLLFQAICSIYRTFLRGEGHRHGMAGVLDFDASVGDKIRAAALIYAMCDGIIPGIVRLLDMGFTPDAGKDGRQYFSNEMVFARLWNDEIARFEGFVKAERADPMFKPNSEAVNAASIFAHYLH
jgi:hypothetical protein